MMTNNDQRLINKLDRKIRKILKSEMSVGRIGVHFTEVERVRIDNVDLSTIVCYIEFVKNSIRSTQDGRDSFEIELSQVIDPTLCWLEVEWAEEV